MFKISKHETNVFDRMFAILIQILYPQEEQVSGEFRLRAPSLPPGRRFSIQISASQPDLLKASKVKIIAIDDEAIPYTDVSVVYTLLYRNAIDVRDDECNIRNSYKSKKQTNTNKRDLCI